MTQAMMRVLPVRVNLAMASARVTSSAKFDALLDVDLERAFDTFSRGRYPALARIGGDARTL